LHKQQKKEYKLAGFTKLRNFAAAAGRFLNKWAVRRRERVPEGNRRACFAKILQNNASKNIKL